MDNAQYDWSFQQTQQATLIKQMIDLALKRLFSPPNHVFFLIVLAFFPLDAYKIRLRKVKMPCQGLLNDMGKLPPGFSRDFP